MIARKNKAIKLRQVDDLYFIAINPREPLKSRVTEIKMDLQAKFNTKAALKSPPHITMHMPFRWKLKKIDLITTTLEQLAVRTKAFYIELKDFAAFPPRVIYLSVAENNALNNLKSGVSQLSLQKWKLFDRVDSRPFHPHMTVAFRDLTKVNFEKAWELFKTRAFEEQFLADKITLLKHNGKFWEEFMEFSFQDK